MKDYYPKRIVCLTEETTEMLYLLGEEERIVGISIFTKRPERALKEKPKVSAFTDAKLEKIKALKPDLVIGFSDIQADIAKDLIKEGITVWVNNHRSVTGILSMMIQLGALVGKEQKAFEIVEEINKNIKKIQEETKTWKRKPTVYFEEWYEPMISGIGWVSEIIHLAGGEDIFPELGKESLAKNRIIANPERVIQANPDIILASWCGKKFKKDQMISRDNWDQITAIKENQVFEIPSETILQPGPASLMVALPELFEIFREWGKK
ncbi:MAG: cobalamin-binding protein [Flavobacteriales bacterium]|jgi:iron complex transport system substrate-binding protein|nr:cobalamin-binding protein [Flavobacteriales bacterium]